MVNVKTRKTRFAPTRLSLSVAAAVAALGSMPAQAISIDTGNSDVEMRWDNTVRYNAGWRMEDRNPHYYNKAATDESEGHFKKGDMVTNRLDLLSEVDFSYQGTFGFRVSGALWSENAYGDKSNTNPTLRFGATPLPSNYGPSGAYSQYAKRYTTGTSGEILDAFVFGNFQLGQTSLKLKAGSHNVFWGEALYSVGDGVSAGQGPLDTIKAATSPGVEAKELFMPLNQVSAQWQLTDEVSLISQYLLDWKPYRLSTNGTYFNNSDGGGNPWGGDPAYAAVNANATGTPNWDAITPGRKGGDYGVAMRWSPSWLDGTVGFYYRKYDEKTPWNVTQVTNLGAAGVRLAYARDTELFGVSMSRSFGGVSVGSELSFRHNSALNSVAGFFAGSNGVRQLIAGTPTYSQVEGARGDTWHFLLNSIYLLPQTRFWSAGTLQGELVYQRLDKVTKNSAVYFSEDYACKTGYAALGLRAGQKNMGDGCTTKDSLSLSIGFTPQWPQLFAGWDVSMPTSYSVGLKGNSPTIGGSYEGAYKYSIGIKGTYQGMYDVTLAYNDAHVDYKRFNGLATTAASSSDGAGVVNNKGWLSLSFKTSF